MHHQVLEPGRGLGAKIFVSMEDIMSSLDDISLEGEGWVAETKGGNPVTETMLFEAVGRFVSIRYPGGGGDNFLSFCQLRSTSANSCS